MTTLVSLVHRTLIAHFVAMQKHFHCVIRPTYLNLIQTHRRDDDDYDYDYDYDDADDDDDDGTTFCPNKSIAAALRMSCYGTLHAHLSI